MNFVSLVLHGFKALMVFVEDVLVRVGIACAIVAMLSVSGYIAAVSLKFLGFSTPGWFSMALGILVLIFMQTGMLSLMSLLLVGMLKGGAVSDLDQYDDFITEVLISNRIINMSSSQQIINILLMVSLRR